MKKSVRWGIIVVILLFVGVMVIYPKFRKSELSTETQALSPAVPSNIAQKGKALPISIEVLKPEPLIDKIVNTGSIIPDEEVNLNFETSGKVVGIFFIEGTKISKGDLLAKINDAPLQAQLKKLEAQLPLHKERVYRQKTLLSKDAVSQEAYDVASTDLDKLDADIELVKANIAQTELRAPFDGIIGLRNISEGAYANTGTSLAMLTKIKPLKIEFSYPERYSGIIKKGTPITFMVDGILSAFDASVYATESMIDSKIGSLRARAYYPNTNETLMPGRNVSVHISISSISNAITVSSEAIIPEMGKSIIYRYINGKAEPVEVITGMRNESKVQIVKGLTAGDTIITTGVMQLRKGMPVIIDNVKQTE